MINFQQAIIDAVALVPSVKEYLTVGALKTIGQYDRQLWDYSLALYRGGDPGIFIDQFAAAISNQLTRAWHEGADSVGVAKEDMTEEDKDYLTAIIDSEYDHVLDLAADIEAAQAGTLEEFRARFVPRIDMWVLRYTDVVNQAKVYFGGKTRMVWTLGATEEHCITCAALNGICAFAEEWEEAGVYPQNAPNQALACGGWRCDCSLEVTDKRRSAGALARIMDAATLANT